MLARTNYSNNIQETIDLLSSETIFDTENIRSFEHEFEHYIGVPSCFAFNSGHDALFIALKAMNLSSKDEVLIQSLTYCGLIDVIAQAGATPVLIDSSLDDLNANESQILDQITERTRVIIPIHTFGLPCNIKEIASIARENDCCLIEDCAHSIGGKYNGVTLGNYGDMAIFSFHFDKPLSTGRGGILAVKNAEYLAGINEQLTQYERAPLEEELFEIISLMVLKVALRRDVYDSYLSRGFGKQYLRQYPDFYTKLRDLIQQKVPEETFVQEIKDHLKANKSGRDLQQNIMFRAIRRQKKWLNEKIRRPAFHTFDITALKMNSILSLIGIHELRQVSAYNAQRNRIAAKFYSSIEPDDAFQVPHISEGKEPTLLKFNIMHKSEETVKQISSLSKKAGFEIDTFTWPEPSHTLEPYRSLARYRKNGMKNCEYIATHLLNVPVHAEVQESDIEAISELFNSFKA